MVFFLHLDYPSFCGICHYTPAAFVVMLQEHLRSVYTLLLLKISDTIKVSSIGLLPEPLAIVSTDR